MKVIPYIKNFNKIDFVIQIIMKNIFSRFSKKNSENIFCLEFCHRKMFFYIFSSYQNLNEENISQKCEKSPKAHWFSKGFQGFSWFLEFSILTLFMNFSFPKNTLRFSVNIFESQKTKFWKILCFKKDSVVFWNISLNISRK